MIWFAKTFGAILRHGIEPTERERERETERTNRNKATKHVSWGWRVELPVAVLNLVKGSSFTFLLSSCAHDF